MQQVQRTGSSVRGRLINLLGGLVTFGSAIAFGTGLLPQMSATQPKVVAAQVHAEPTDQPTLSGHYPFGAHGFDALLAPVAAPVPQSALSGHYPFGAHGFDALLVPTSPTTSQVARQD